MKLKFDGWYRLWDDRIDGDAAEKKLGRMKEKHTLPYQDNVYDAFGSDLTLYGRWIPSIDVNFNGLALSSPQMPPAFHRFPCTER